MRIISGKYRGRRLQPPASLPVRPTTDFAKVGLFNVLANMVDFESVDVLDLFSGTGSIAFEFLSRGAISVMAVDANVRCVGFIKKTAESFGARNIQAVRTNSFVFLRHMKGSFGIIFADPPYDLENMGVLPDLVTGSGLLVSRGLFILEHGSAWNFEGHRLFEQQRQYGSVNFSFFRQE